MSSSAGVFEPAIRNALVNRFHSQLVCLHVDRLCGSNGAGVFRVTLDPALPNGDETVVLKIAGRRRAAFAAELSAFRLLHGLRATRALVPTVYAVDERRRWIVMEDLEAGAGQRLAAVLDAKRARPAQDALICLQTTLGRLHAGTLSRRRLDRRNARRCLAHPVGQLKQSLRHFAHLPSLLGVRDRVGFATELETALHELSWPGEFETFTHGDPTTVNSFYSGGNVRLIDLETGDFRHAMVDGAFCRIRYLCSTNARLIPERVQRAMQLAYRAQLAAVCRAAEDDASFNAGLMASSTAWLAVLCTHLGGVIRRDRQWGSSTLRQRICAALRHYLSLADETRMYPGTAAVARGMLLRVTTRWPASDVRLPAYRAFDSSP